MQNTLGNVEINYVHTLPSSGVRVKNLGIDLNSKLLALLLDN